MTEIHFSSDHSHEWVRDDDVPPTVQLWTCAGCPARRSTPPTPSTIEESAERLKGQLPIDSITLRQDVGAHYPVYKRVTLDLMPDGTMRWRDVVVDS